jgi:aspartyl-tRNA(Asn)/glutamyl-tRNA(Gln) amidotransferase subunit C
MTLSIKDTQKVAKLARIRLNDAELETYTGALNSILAWIDQLQEVDTNGVAQMTSVAAVTLPMRADAVTEGGIQAQIVSNAPAAEYGCFVVPKVIE